MQTFGRRQNPLKRPWHSGSKMGYYLSYFRRGTSILLDQGWGNFWGRFRNKTKRWVRRRLDSNQLYQRWIKRNEPAPEAMEKERQESFSFQFRPKVSLIILLRNPEASLLTLAIDSVVRQTYDNWELCLADGSSGKSCVRQILQEYAEKDSRIKVKSLNTNGGVSGTSNGALSLATGEFCGWLDQDDQLAPFAVYVAAKALNDNPSLDFIYSDEDKIDLRQKRSVPFFKPDWSPDMLLSFMYTGHLSLYRKSLVDTLGGFRPEYEGSQDYDLALRVIEKTNRIYHIPRILYHRRMGSFTGPRNEGLTTLPDSSPRRGKGPGMVLRHSRITRPEIGADGLETRKEEKTREFDRETDKKALTNYLVRNNIEGKVCDGTWKGAFRVRREISGNPLVSIIIPNKDKVELLKRCVESVVELTEYKNYEILIVDNQSTKTKDLVDYYSEIGKRPGIRIIEYNRPFNFAALNNFAVSQTRGEHILLLNNDTQVISGEWLSAMLEHSQRKEVGAVGAKLLFPDGSIQHCGVIIGPGMFAGHVCIRHPDSPGYFGRIGIINNYSAVTAACVMIRREVFEEMSGFDENLAVAYNDIDLCLRMRERGYLIVYTPYARLYHLESFTRGYTLTREKLAIYSKEYQYVVTRWEDTIEKGDPYYNPNLSLTNPDFSIEEITRLKT